MSSAVCTFECDSKLGPSGLSCLPYWLAREVALKRNCFTLPTSVVCLPCLSVRLICDVGIRLELYKNEWHNILLRSCGWSQYEWQSHYSRRKYRYYLRLPSSEINNRDKKIVRYFHCDRVMIWSYDACIVTPELQTLKLHDMILTLSQ